MFDPRSRQHFLCRCWFGPTTRKNKKEGHAGVEPATYRAATDCSTTELMPLTCQDKKADMAKWQGNRFVSGRSGVRSPLSAHVFFRCTNQDETTKRVGFNTTLFPGGPPTPVLSGLKPRSLRCSDENRWITVDMVESEDKRRSVTTCTSAVPLTTDT